jgi:hypothetical protein
LLCPFRKRLFVRCCASTAGEIEITSTSFRNTSRGSIHVQ